MRNLVTPRVVRRLEENTCFSKSLDPSLRIVTAGRLGASARDGQHVDARLVEQEGWVPASDIDPRLLLAAQGGYDAAMISHLNAVSPHEKLEDNVGVIKSVLDTYTRPEEMEWVVMSNGTVAIQGEFDTRNYDGVQVTVDYHGMLDITSVDHDRPAPSLCIGRFVARKQRALDHKILFKKDVHLVGLSGESTDTARAVAQEAAQAFVRPSGNRSRLLSVSVQGVDDQDMPVGKPMVRRWFDVEYRWRSLEREEARFNGSAEELNGELIDRVGVVITGIRNRQLVAGVVAHTSGAVPHTEAALVSRLRRYDKQLQSFPELVKDGSFVASIGITSTSLMPQLESQLRANPGIGTNPEFRMKYNLCAAYTRQPAIHV